MNKILLIMILTVLYHINYRGGGVVANDIISQETTNNIQGNWSSIWINARSDKIDEKVHFQFIGDKVRVIYKKGINPIESKFKILSSDESGKGSIDITSSSTQKIVKGLYILKRDTLVLFIPSAGEPRPKEISSNLKMDENILFLILVRDK